jgi:hypothetical protein
MFCARCGQQIPDASEICPLCGRDANIKLAIPSGAAREAAATAVASAPSETTALHPIRKELQGVGGWLLLFCIGLVVLNPLLILVRVINAANTDVRGMVLEFSLAAFGIVVGIFLWNARLVAFTLLWIYFGVVAAFALLGIIAFAVSPAPVESQNLVFSIRPLIYVFMWFLYFRTSERVRAIFGRNL